MGGRIAGPVACQLGALLLSLCMGHAAAQGVSAVRVLCDGAADGAEIRINGVYKGDCPLDAEVEPGQIEVTALKKVDAQRERRFSTRFGLGEGVVKRVDVQLGPAELNPEARREHEARQRAEAERRRVEAEAARKAADEKRLREEAQAARQAELRRLAVLQQEQRRRERTERLLAAFAEAGLAAGTGQVFRDCADCPEMVWIPPGRAPQVAVGRSTLQPWMNRLELAVPLAVGRFEVSYDEWDACVAQGGCSHRPAEGTTEGLIFDSRWGRGRQPVIFVSVPDVQQYLAWLSQRTGHRYRLLSQQEHFYAARAGAATLFPWGDRRDTGAANCKDCGGKSTDRALPVGSFPANAWGLHDMIGNVAEWVSDCFGGNAQLQGKNWSSVVTLNEQPVDGSPIDRCSAAPQRAAVHDPVHGLSGASFRNTIGSDASITQWQRAQQRSSNLGLRVAREFVLPAPAQDAAARAPFRDCADCPELVRLPAGRFEMGTAYLSEQGWTEDEFPLRWVSVPAFAIGRHEVTRAEWAAFSRERAVSAPVAVASAVSVVALPPAQAASAEPTEPTEATEATEPAEAPAAPAAITPPGCQVVRVNGRVASAVPEAGRHATDPGFPQGDDHPVTCITRADAQAYLDWLSQRTGQRYRLPTEAEWEYAARAGQSDRRPWPTPAEACRHGNLRDQRFREVFATNDQTSCNDGSAVTAPVGQRQANAWGLHDMLGNVAEMVADCRGPYAQAPTDGRAATSPDCKLWVVRGGSWFSHPGSLAATLAGRQGQAADASAQYVGLRVVRELGPTP